MVIDKIALTLAIIGALNWGSVGLFGFDCVAFLFGGQIGMLSRVIYTLVGLAGIWCITMLFREKEPMESGGQTLKIKGEGLALSFYFCVKNFPYRSPVASAPSSSRIERRNWR